MKSEVDKSILEARKSFNALSGNEKTDRINKGRELTAGFVRHSALRKLSKGTSCSFDAVLAGESLSRGPIKLDEVDNTISREVRVLPNLFVCHICGLQLEGYQKLLQAQLGEVFITSEEEDPIEFFGIIPEDHVDVDKLVRDYHQAEYDNE